MNGQDKKKLLDLLEEKTFEANALSRSAEEAVFMGAVAMGVALALESLGVPEADYTEAIERGKTRAEEALGIEKDSFQQFLAALEAAGIDFDIA